MNLRRDRWRLLAAVATLFLLGAPATAQFADRDRDGVSYPTDCNDGNQGAAPGAAEACDGFDNACSGETDSGCFRACPAPRADLEVTLASSPGASAHARVAWTNDGFDIVWVDERHGEPEIYLGRYDAWGVERYAETRVTTSPSLQSDPAVASPGDWRGIAWVDHRHGNPEIYFSRISDAGLGDARDVRVTATTEDDLDPALVFAGSGWAIAYTGGRQTLQIQISRLTDYGAFTNSVVVSGKTGSARRPSISWTGNGHGVVWEDDRHGETEIYFRALDSALIPTTGEVRVTTAPGASSAPSIAWVGGKFIVAWVDGRDGNAEAYAAVLDTTGTRIGPELRLSNDPDATGAPRVASTGGEAEVVWIGGPAGAAAPYLARVGRDGSIVEAGRVISSPGTGFSSADVAWSGSFPIVVWEDGTAGAIRAARPRCCGDEDGDGADRCEGDCDDGRVEVGPSAAESCNGLDDDCDGETDEGCERRCGGPDLVAAPVEHRLGGPVNVEDAALASNGSEIGAAWDQSDSSSPDAKVIFRKLAVDGTPLTPPIEMPAEPGRDLGEPAVAACPGGWAVFYGSSGTTAEVVLRRLDTQGVPSATVGRLDTRRQDVGEMGLVWNGRGFASVHEGRTSGSGSEAYLTRWSSEAVRIGDPILLGAYPNYARRPSLVWNGTGYVIAAQYYTSTQGSGIYLWEFDVDGKLVAGPTRVAFYDWSETDPALVFTGDGYGLVLNRRPDLVDFVRLSPSFTISGYYGGVTFDPGHELVSPSIAWNGEEFHVQWNDTTMGIVRAARLDAGGYPVSSGIEVGVAGSSWWNAGDTALAAVAGAFLSGHADISGPVASMVTRSLGCCPGGDPDGDGSCLADCGEGDPLRYPGAPERCNGLDDDCDGAAPGEGPFDVVRGLRFLDRETLAWDESAAGPYYDVVRGDLGTLLGANGNFIVATDTCVVGNRPVATATDATIPLEGSGLYYCVAGGSISCPGTFEDGDPSQAGTRTSEILGSAGACP